MALLSLFLSVCGAQNLLYWKGQMPTIMIGISLIAH